MKQLGFHHQWCSDALGFGSHNSHSTGNIHSREQSSMRVSSGHTGNATSALGPTCLLLILESLVKYGLYGIQIVHITPLR